MANKVRWGILGGAGIAKMAVLPAIASSSNAEISAVASRSMEKSREMAKMFSADSIYQDYDALLSDTEVDAVYIPLPNTLHEYWTIKAARAGKAILCEKPLSVDEAGARRMVEACAENRVPFLEGFMYRFHPQHRRVREILNSGTIGDVVEVQAHLSVDLMSPPDPANVRFDPALGGGALLDMGCYTVDIARSYIGEPVSVQASWTTDPVFGVDVSAAAVLNFDDRKRAVVSCSFQGNGQGHYRIVGRNGMIEVPRAIIPGLGTRNSETIVVTIDADGNRTEETIAPIDQYQQMIETYSVAILKREKPPFDPELSISNMKCLDAIARSASEGERVTLQ